MTCAEESNEADAGTCGDGQIFDGGGGVILLSSTTASPATERRSVRPPVAEREPGSAAKVTDGGICRPISAVFHALLQGDAGWTPAVDDFGKRPLGDTVDPIVKKGRAA